MKDAVILVGGRGRRLHEVTGDMPKPMVLVDGKPLLVHLIELCRRESLTRIHLLCGYGAETIRSELGSGSILGVELIYHVEREPRGTAGAARDAAEHFSEQIVLFYGDVFTEMSVRKVIEFHQERLADCTIVVHPNRHPADSDLIELEDDRVVAVHSRPHRPGAKYRNLVNAGVAVIKRELLLDIPAGKNLDLGKDLFPLWIKSRRFVGYRTAEYLRDIGTPARWSSVNFEVRRGLHIRRRRDLNKPVIFLDRDGTINRHNGYVCTPDEFELFPDASKAIGAINDSDYLVIVVTNQPQIARGELTFAGLDLIHRKMDWILGRDGAKLDGVYVCPHHPDAGFSGEVQALKIPCQCRKPGLGMFEAANRDFGISFSESWMIGDSECDILAANYLKMKSAWIAPLKTRLEHAKGNPDLVCETLAEAVNLILK